MTVVTPDPATSPTRSPGQALLVVVVCVIGWRLALLLAMFVGLHTSVEKPGNANADYRAFPYRPPQGDDPRWARVAPREFPDVLLDAFCRWDAGWYGRIAAEGYRDDPRANFFPGFPYCARWLGQLLGISHWSGGLLVSQLGLIIGLWTLYLLTAQWFDDARALLTVQLALSWPGSFFQSAYMSEGLYLGLSVPATWAFLQRRYVTAGLLGALATIVRPTGSALAVGFVAGLLWNLLQRREAPRLALAGVLLVPLGLAAVMAIQQRQLGDPLAYVHAHQRYWPTHRSDPLTTMRHKAATIDWRFPRRHPLEAEYRPFAIRGLEFLITSAMLLVPFAMWRRLPLALSLYALTVAVLPTLGGHMEASIRHAGIVFPLFIWLADVLQSRPLARQLTLVSWLMLQPICAVAYANWYWVG
jgi:hypothetical protein